MHVFVFEYYRQVMCLLGYELDLLKEEYNIKEAYPGVGICAVPKMQTRCKT